MVAKFKGLSNTELQIKASFSHDERYIVCGSDDQSVFMWKCPPQEPGIGRTLRNKTSTDEAYQAFRVSSDSVTSAKFIKWGSKLVIVTADSKGEIKAFTFEHYDTEAKANEKTVRKK